MRPRKRASCHKMVRGGDPGEPGGMGIIRGTAGVSQRAAVERRLPQDGGTRAGRPGLDPKESGP